MITEKCRKCKKRRKKRKALGLGWGNPDTPGATPISMGESLLKDYISLILLR